MMSRIHILRIPGRLISQVNTDPMMAGIRKEKNGQEKGLSPVVSEYRMYSYIATSFPSKKLE